MIVEDKYPPILYKYMDYEGGLSMIMTEELWFTRAKKLNDPYDCFVSHDLYFQKGHLKYKIDFKGFFDNVGICSLCNNPSNFTMWSYYNQHRGLCVGLNMDAVSKIFGKTKTLRGPKKILIKKVVYQRDVPKINPDDLISQDHLSKDDNFDRSQNAFYTFFAAKSDLWVNENEYRLILMEGYASRNDEPAKVRVSDLVNSVYIGCKNDLDTAYLLKLAKNINFNLYKMRINPDEYGLDYDALYTIKKCKI